MESKRRLQPLSPRNQQIIAMRRDGATHAQIAEAFGISRQRSHQICGKRRVYSFRQITPKQCIYGNIRDYLNRTRTSIYEVTRQIYGYSHSESSNRISRILSGKLNPRKTDIDDILLVTGLTYEEAFAEDDPEETDWD